MDENAPCMHGKAQGSCWKCCLHLDDWPDMVSLLSTNLHLSVSSSAIACSLSCTQWCESTAYYCVVSNAVMTNVTTPQQKLRTRYDNNYWYMSANLLYIEAYTGWMTMMSEPFLVTRKSFQLYIHRDTTSYIMPVTYQPPRIQYKLRGNAIWKSTQKPLTDLLKKMQMWESKIAISQWNLFCEPFNLSNAQLVFYSIESSITTFSTCCKVLRSRIETTPMKLLIFLLQQQMWNNALYCQKTSCRECQFIHIVQGESNSAGLTSFPLTPTGFTRMSHLMLMAHMQTHVHWQQSKDTLYHRLVVFGYRNLDTQVHCQVWTWLVLSNSVTCTAPWYNLPIKAIFPGIRF